MKNKIKIFSLIIIYSLIYLNNQTLWPMEKQKDCECTLDLSNTIMLNYFDKLIKIKIKESRSNIFYLIHSLAEILDIDSGAYLNQQYKSCSFKFGDINKILSKYFKYYKIDVNTQNKTGDSPLIQAINLNYKNISKFLIKYPKTNINLKNNDKQNALMIAAEQPNRIKAIKYIIKYRNNNIDINDKNKYKRTALMIAASNNNAEALTLILSHPYTNINLKDQDGFTALFLASHLGLYNIVEMLLEQKEIDADLTDNHGDTAETIVIKSYNISCIVKNKILINIYNNLINLFQEHKIRKCLT